MKNKAITLIIILTLSITSKAQSTDKQHSLETQFDIFTKSGAITPYLKYRYFINENSVLRSTLLIHYSSKTESILQSNDVGVGSIQRINSMTNFALGYEHHLSDERLSPYIGIELMVGTGKNDVFGLRTDSLVFVNTLNYSSKRRINQFGVGIFTGVDFELYKGLFIGTEIGFSIINTNYKEGEFRVDDSASSTAATTTTKIPEIKFNTFSLVNIGTVRVGWKF